MDAHTQHSFLVGRLADVDGIRSRILHVWGCQGYLRYATVALEDDPKRPDLPKGSAFVFDNEYDDRLVLHEPYEARNLLHDHKVLILKDGRIGRIRAFWVQNRDLMVCVEANRLLVTVNIEDVQFLFEEVPRYGDEDDEAR